MQFSNIPAKFTIPWGNGAGGGFIRTIPTASQIAVTPGAASLTDGFPPLNFQPVGSGGVPPFGQDMNGILNQVTAWSRWQGVGGTPQYDATFSTAVGGYPQGAIVSSSTTSGLLWLCTADNNTSNPDTGGANWVAIAIAATANTTFWVRTDGNDNNNGSANTAGSAFATIAAAINYALRRYTFGGFTLTIQLGITGTYAAPGPLPPSSATIILRGDPANQALYNISGTGPGGGNQALIAANSTQLQLIGVSINNNGAINHNVSAGLGGSVFATNVTFNTLGGAGGFALLAATPGGSVFINSGCVFAGSFSYMLSALSGNITIGANIAVASTPAYGTATASAASCGTITVGINGLVFTGTGATGTRYSATMNGAIQTLGGGANYFPGNAAGTTATGGQYAP